MHRPVLSWKHVCPRGHVAGQSWRFKRLSTASASEPLLSPLQLAISPPVLLPLILPAFHHPKASFDTRTNFSCTINQPSYPIFWSVTFGLSSTPETAPPSFPVFPRVQQAEEAGMSLSTESPMLCFPWDPGVTISVENHMASIHRRSVHQQPSAPASFRNIELLIPPVATDYEGLPGN